jgi:hypothetical protein
MATDDQRTCAIFRIERGTFEECHTRTLNFDYPSLADDENVFLRVTRLSSSEANSPSSTHSHSHHSSHKKFNSSAISSHESWEESGRSLNDNSSTGKATRTRLHSLSDDYVFL